MTVQEIKDNTTMPDLMRGYGIQIRNNMCKCMFHSDKSPSMKVYKDGCHCFTCNKSWDLFSFVQEYEGCDFKTAFLKLGGTYKTFQSETDKILAERKFKAKKAAAERAEKDKAELRRIILISLYIIQAVIELYEPLSDEWCEAQNEKPVIDWYFEQFILGKEIDKQDVHRRYRKLNQRFLTIG